jgi:hypothetical protein
VLVLHAAREESSMSAAAVLAPTVDEQRYTRFRQLLTWLEGLGVCTCCRVGMALERVEIEGGDKAFKAATLPCKPLRNADGSVTTCRDRANIARASMPKRAA